MLFLKGKSRKSATSTDPELGRFIQPDTIIQAPYDPQTLNRYSYCRNNPILYTDPSGHFFWVAAIIGAIVGAVLGGISAAQSGQEIWKGVLGGAISGFGAGFGNFYAAVAWGAFSGAGGAALSGGNIGMGALLGGASTAVGWGFGSLAKGNIAAKFLASTATGAVMGGLSSELAGGDFGEGAMWGALYSGVGFVASTLAHGAYNNSQAKTKIQQALVEGDLSNTVDTQRGLAYAERVSEGATDVFKQSTPSDSTSPGKIFRLTGRLLQEAGYKTAGKTLSTVGIILEPGGTGKIAGIIAGGATGAKFGAGIGSIIAPGPGTFVGGVLGGVTGGVIGGTVGSWFDSPDAGNAY